MIAWWTTRCCQHSPGIQRILLQTLGWTLQCCTGALVQSRDQSGQRLERRGRRPGWRCQRQIHTVEDKKKSKCFLKVGKKGYFLPGMASPPCSQPLWDKRRAAVTAEAPSQYMLKNIYIYVLFFILMREFLPSATQMASNIFLVLVICIAIILSNLNYYGKWEVGTWVNNLQSWILKDNIWGDVGRVPQCWDSLFPPV